LAEKPDRSGVGLSSVARRADSLGSKFVPVRKEAIEFTADETACKYPS
jgi:hypothetical protein